MFRFRRLVGFRSRSFFKIKKGQIVLLLLAAMGIGSLAGWTVYSSTPHQVEKSSILSESNDAASLAYSQRESFNLALSIEDWVRGEINIRDVEISRALLGQRLRVKLVDGRATYDVMTPDYKRILNSVDNFIIVNRSTTFANRSKIFEEFRSTNNAFLTETRRMSKAIQLVSLKQVNKVVQNRSRAELYQSGILLSVIGIGLIFLIWIIRDLSSAFRRAQNVLEVEQNKLNLATQKLDLSQALDRFQVRLADLDLIGLEESDFENIFQKLIAEEMPNSTFSIVPEGLSFRLSRVEDSSIDGETFDLLQIRFADAMKQHEARFRLFEEAEYRAEHDLLTGFLNERGLTGLLEYHTWNEADQFAAIFIDVDRFHRINDSMGFEYGDTVMREIGSRMRAAARPGEHIARLNSDEFVYITPVTDEVDAREKALALQSVLQFTTYHNQIELSLTFTVGLVIFKSAQVSASQLLHHGALALNIANRQIRTGFAMYSESQGQEYVESLAEEFAIRQAIKLNEFELYYQPVIELTTKTVMGGEALLRWNRPGYGVLGPEEFLLKVRDHDLEIELGEWVIENALRFRVNARLFQEEMKLSSFRVGINVEAAQLRRPDFADKLLESIQRLNISAADVSVEVTEHALTDGDIALQQLQRLKSYNFVIAIDDFGTGYSNLSQVHSLPISVLKIDKSFLIPSAGKPIDTQLVLDIKQLADNLKLRVVAEGVETASVEKFLVESGITRVQGFHYSPPLPEINFWSWVREFNNTNAFLAGD